MSTKLIRRFLIASGLVLGATAAFSPTAFADTTGNVILKGTVTSTLAITSATTAGAGTLALDGAAANVEQIVQVADLGISTNNEQGYTLTAGAGNLTKAGGSNIAYQVTSVVDGTTAPATGAFTAGTYSVGSIAAGAEAKDLYIKYTPAPLQDAGEYGATIALTVTDNT